MVRSKELKPPEGVVQAIQSSEDGTAPATADASGAAFEANVPRTVRAHLMHEQQQQLAEAPANAHGAVPHVMSKEERKAMHAEQHAMQNKAPQYDRQHPGATKAGRGDQAQGSIQNLHGTARAPVNF